MEYFLVVAFFMEFLSELVSLQAGGSKAVQLMNRLKEISHPDGKFVLAHKAEAEIITVKLVSIALAMIAALLGVFYCLVFMAWYMKVPCIVLLGSLLVNALSKEKSKVRFYVDRSACALSLIYMVVVIVVEKGAW